MTTYTVDRIKDIDDIDGELAFFLTEEAKNIQKMFDDKYDLNKFDFLRYARNNLFLVCRRNKKTVGVLMAAHFFSGIDQSVKILSQQLLYVKRPAGRAAYTLMQHFIDFGKLNADHVITMIGANTNIKPRSLEKLGFNKIEELYRMET